MVGRDGRPFYRIDRRPRWLGTGVSGCGEVENLPWEDQPGLGFVDQPSVDLHPVIDAGGESVAVRVGDLAPSEPVAEVLLGDPPRGVVALDGVGNAALL